MDKLKIEPECFDLELTLTCGQTFCWHRFDGELYGENEDQRSSGVADSTDSATENNRFYTFRGQKPLIVEGRAGELIVETELSRSEVEKALGLDKDLDNVFSEFPEDPKLEKARNEFEGLRIVQDEFFPCLVSYLCSPQMQIPRIKQMHNEIARRWGETHKVDGEELLRFPTREELSEATEEELRDIGVGYRAKYIAETLEIMEDGFETSEIGEMNYPEAKEHLKKLYGVGDKVADCVLLFSQGFHEAPPLDTWAKKALETHYPALHSEDYQEAVNNIQDRFGDHSGYAVEYLFHAARQGVLET